MRSVVCVPLVSDGQDSREGLYGADGRLVHIDFFFPAHTETPHASFTLTDPLLQLRDLSLHPEKHPEENNKEKHSRAALDLSHSNPGMPRGRKGILGSIKHLRDFLIIDLTIFILGRLK